MATAFNGTEAGVYGAGYVLDTLFKSFKLSGERGVYEKSALSTLWKLFTAGKVSGELNAEGIHTTGALEVSPILNAIHGTTKTFMLCPEDTVGSVFAGIEGSVISRAFSGDNSDLVMAVMNVIAKQGADLGHLCHVNSAQTGTFSGTSVDTGITAASAGGAVYLNVTAYAGTAAQMTLKFEDSANNSDWADIPGATWTAAEIVAGFNDKIVIPPTEAIDRYVRVSGTDAGAMDSITFTAGVCKYK